MHKNTDEIFILTKRTGYIPHLKTYGPIPNPIKCPISLCMSMIIAGVELYELDPETKLTTKLTLENLMRDDKFGSKKESETIVVVDTPINQVGVSVTPLTASVSEVKQDTVEDEDPEDEDTDEVDEDEDSEPEDEANNDDDLEVAEKPLNDKVENQPAALEETKPAQRKPKNKKNKKQTQPTETK